MYIAIVIAHDNFGNIKESFFTHIKKAIDNCVNDNHNVHIYFYSKNSIHKFDKFFNHKRYRLNHIIDLKYTNDFKSVFTCYHNHIVKAGYDYHWLIKIRPDLLVFDPNIFNNIRSKYSYDSIHARARYYIGTKDLKKHQRSDWGDSAKQILKDTLHIADDQLYMIPYPLQYFAFSKSTLEIETNHQTNVHKTDELSKLHSLYEASIHNIIDCPEKTQTLLWKRFNIPIKIAEFYVVVAKDFGKYNDATDANLNKKRINYFI
jgi:hypothetical protein